MIPPKPLQQVRDFWEKQSCGEALYLAGNQAFHYREQSRQRYDLEPFIEELARFEESRGRRVLEIGVGLGADHQRFADAGALVHGMDLTRRAIDHVRARFSAFGLESRLLVGDGQKLPYRSESFDCVYSWGVIHHAPEPREILDEAFRVLVPGGSLRIMIYHKWSIVGLMLWIRYALFRLRPFLSLTELYSRYLESPGTKAYTTAEALNLLNRFEKIELKTVLTHGDLLTSAAGQRHRGLLLSVARALWPRRILRTLFPKFGLFMIISAEKSLEAGINPRS